MEKKIKTVAPQKAVLPYGMQISFKKNKIDIHYYLFRNIEGDMINFLIPGLNIFFSASDMATGKVRANNALKFYFDYWLKQENFRKLILELNRLKFKTPNHNIVVRDLLNQKSKYAKFSSHESVTSDRMGENYEFEKMSLAV